MAENEIVIDLSKQGDAQSYDVGSLIQREARAKFIELAESFIESIGNKKQKSCFGQLDRVHNTILINGKRGMGKTTFMLSILEELCGNSKPKDDCEQYKKCRDKEENNPPKDTSIVVDTDGLRRDICVLDILDPTLIETKEHVLLNIITKIKIQVEKHRECRQECKERDGDYHEWMKSLKKLAGGVNLLDGVGSDAPLKDKLYEDSALVLEQGLSDTKQGAKLEEYLHEFIKKSLDMLGKKAFLLVFDDIDTSLKEGRHILETLRKYLTSRQLITVMLGDIDLYSTLVRQLQWEKIDPNKTLKEYEAVSGGKFYSDYRAQIEHLEEQYLVKLLKPENRIDLETIFVLRKSIKLSGATIGQKQELELVMEQMAKTVFLVDKSIDYQSLFIKLILLQPVRSVLQILKEWDKLENSRLFITKIKHTFFTSLRALELHGLLDIDDDSKFLNYLSMYVLQSKDIDRDNHLKLVPDFKSDSKNIQIMYINSVANHVLSKDKANYLDYFIKVGYSAEVFSQPVPQNKKPGLDTFVTHIGLDSTESTALIAKRILATLRINYTNMQNRELKPFIFGNHSVTIKELGKIDNKYLLTLSRVVNKQKRYAFASFFNILGLIADLSRNDGDGVRNVLKRNSQILEFKSFWEEADEIKTTNIKSPAQQNMPDDEIDNSPDELGYDYSDIEQNMVKWASIKLEHELPLFVLAKIWIRNSYTVQAIDTKSRSTIGYAEYIHRCIIGFLNAVLIEVKTYHDLNNNIKLSNAIESDKIFFDNLGLCKPNDDFFDWLIKCPLWSLYLNDATFKRITKLIDPAKQIKDGELSVLLDFTKETPVKQAELIEEALDSIKTTGQYDHRGIITKLYSEWTEEEFLKIYEAIKYRVAKNGFQRIGKNIVRNYLAK